MSQSTQLSTIQFHNQTLITFEQDNVQYVAMRPLCENIGLQWESQYNRIKRDEVLSSTMIIMITVAEDGKKREMICLPIEYLNGWLFGIDIKRVKPEIRDLLITYKKECYKALADYWMKGKAERKTTVDERTGLRDAVNMLVSKRGLIYSEAYQMVHQRFNVQSIEDLSQEQLPMAVEYIHKICLEGELITDIPKEDVVEVPLYTFKAIMQHSRLSQKLATQTEHIHRTLFDLLGLERYVRNDLAALAYDVRSEFNEWLRRGEDILIKADPNCAERIRLS
ncbi:phage antirepressor N-terminal domain-containing protein [Haemophilus haemoglobinophilus]|nr:phage antirepressor N-terminal domain-containing protein [Canicola haemoglobinophilus]